MADAPLVKLHVNGQEVAGWTSIRLTKSLEQLVHEFELTISNQRVSALGMTGTGVSRDQVIAAADVVEEEDEVRVSVDGQTVITGYVDRTSLDYDSESVSFRVTGSSKTRDVVDSSAIYKTGAWADADLATIARDLCDPVGITVTVIGSAAPNFKRFRLEPGEKIFEPLSRAAEMRSMLATTNPDGNVELVRATSAPSGAVIELGVNILRGGFERSTRERFSKYIFKGQTSANDEWNGKQASQLKGEVEDPGVRRYRPLVILAQKQRTKEDLGKRAVWERNVRAGRSLRARYTVEGWSTHNGNLWEPNMLVRVKDRWSRIDQELLVTRADLVLEEDYVTNLELMDRSAFDTLT